MTPPKHILGTFDEALSSLRNNVLMMAGLAERTLDRAVKGLLQRDDNLCTAAIADDEEIDQLEKQIERTGWTCCCGSNRSRPIYVALWRR